MKHLNYIDKKLRRRKGESERVLEDRQEEGAVGI